MINRVLNFIKKYKLEDKIETKLTDGLKGLKIYKKEQENQSKSKLSTASTNFALNS